MKKALIVYFRRIRRSRFSFLINLIGLSSGLACTFLIYLWVSDEMSFDTFHEKDEQLYQIWVSQKVNNSIQTGTNTPGVLAEAIVQVLPNVRKSTASISSMRMNTLSFGNDAFKAKGIYADENFLDVFSFKLLEGKKESVLSNETSIVITEEFAKKLFGTTQNVIGKTLEFDRSDQFIISGICENIPSYSTIQFDFILVLPAYERHSGLQLGWGEFVADTYVLLDKDQDLDQFNDQLLEWLEGDGMNTEEFKIFAKKFSEGYLYGNYENGKQSGGRIDYVKLFTIIGIIILIIACINFINMSTVMASSRLKEIGVVKVLGASKKSIILKQIGESIILAFISLAVALILVQVLLPIFNGLAGKEINSNFRLDILLGFVIITLITGILSGIYPGFYISGFKLNTLLKGDLANSLKGQWLRKGLVVVQFAISIILIAFTIVVLRQFSMIQNRSLGYDKDNVVYFDMDGTVISQKQAFLSGLEKIPGVQRASSMFAFKEGFLGRQGKTNSISWPGKVEDGDRGASTHMDYRIVDYDFIELLGLELKEGQTFSKEFRSESDGVIFNESAIKLMGLTDPIGKRVDIWGNSVEIIGVVKDFYFESIHSGPVKPLFLIRVENEGFGAFNTILAKVNGKSLGETLTSIEAYHGEFNPGYPFNYKFVDQDFQVIYAGERRLSRLSTYFAGLAILISCLGLFGLTAYTVAKRKREISIRKLLGSSGWQTILLLYRDISKLVLISLLIGLPISYLLASRWLEGFHLRVDLKLWFFLLAGGLAIFFMVIASGIQVIKVLSIDPAESLRTAE